MKLKESETVELKTSTSELKEAIISIVAILNKHSSGKIIFGVSPKGKVLGQQISDKTMRDISQKIHNSIEPKIYPKINKKKIENKNIIIIEFLGNEPLYYAKDRAYIRVSDEDKKMSAKEIEKRILSKSSIKWDGNISNKKIKDINTKLLKDYIKEAKKTKRLNFSYTNTKNTLLKLKLLKKDNLLNASKILFCDDNNLEVQTAVFAGKDKTTFIDINDKTGNLFEMLKYSENYIKEHINWRADLTTGTRKEIPEIPIRAINEALVNSFCHRDYTAPESNKIAIYKDRVDIWNPGTFTSEHKPMDFVKEELPSILRNPKIAQILYYDEKIEKWGSGLKRIYDECKKNNIRVKFKTLKYGFSVIFYRQKIDKVDTNVDTKPIKRQQWVLNYLKKHNKIKSKIIQNTFNISREIASRDINKLTKEKKIIKNGAGNNVWYELK